MTLFFIFLIAGQGFAADTRTSQGRTVVEKDLDRWNVALEEYHQGKRDDNDGGAILFNLMHDYAVLGSTSSAASIEVRKEWGNLLKKHPEFRKRPPMKVHEEIEAAATAKQHAAEVAEKAKANFVPKDTKAIGLHGDGQNLIVQYQHHLDFYKLPASLTVAIENVNNVVVKNPETGQTIHADGIPMLGIAPSKVMTFRHHIQMPYGVKESKFIWACDKLTARYTFSDQEEFEVLRKKYPVGFQWENTSADYQQFCGAISLDGKIIYQLPMKQHAPDTVFDVGSMTPDGEGVVISIGKEVDLADDTGYTISSVRNIRQGLLWTFPDRLESYDIKDAAKLNAELAGRGFRGHPWPWRR